MDSDDLLWRGAVEAWMLRCCGVQHTIRDLRCTVCNDSLYEEADD